MKKLMFALATAAALVGMADIESANTVGFTTKSITPDQYYLIGTQFQGVGADAQIEMSKLLVLSNIQSVGFDDMIEQGAEILVFDGVGYNHYYYINDAYDSSDNPVEGEYWADIDGYMVTASDVFTLGQGFWLKVPAAACGENPGVTAAGEVTSASDYQLELVGSSDGAYSILSNPYPVEAALADITTTGLTAVGFDDMLDIGNELMIYDGVGYNHYYYINDAYDSNDNPVDGEVWADIDGYEVTDSDKIPVGESFWFRARQNGSLKFSLKK